MDDDIINRTEWNEKWNESEAKTKRRNIKAIDNSAFDVLDDGDDDDGDDDDNTIKATKPKATRESHQKKSAIISLNCKL